MNALANIVHVDGTGVVIVSKPVDTSADVWRTRNVVSIDGGTRVKLLFGSAFHRLEPGDHHLLFGIRGPLDQGTRAELNISVPADGYVRVRYRPAMWLGGEVTAEVQRGERRTAALARVR